MLYARTKQTWKPCKTSANSFHSPFVVLSRGFIWFCILVILLVFPPLITTPTTFTHWYAIILAKKCWRGKEGRICKENPLPGRKVLGSKGHQLTRDFFCPESLEILSLSGWHLHTYNLLVDLNYFPPNELAQMFVNWHKIYTPRQLSFTLKVQTRF